MSCSDLVGSGALSFSTLPGKNQAKLISGRHNMDFETGLTMGSLRYKYSHMHVRDAISYYKLLPSLFRDIKTISNYNLDQIREYHCGIDFLGFLDFSRAIFFHFRTEILTFYAIAH